MNLHLDLETYSSEDLSKVGITKYTAADDFKILLCAYAIDDDPVRVLDIEISESDRAFFDFELAHLLLNFNRAKYIKSAYNASFEIACLARYFKLSEQEYEAMLGSFTCSMAQAAYCGLPIGLSATGKALGLPESAQKSTVGKRLIELFCKPTKKSLAGRVTPQQEPEKWDLFKAYCRQDVEAERAIHQALAAHPLPEDELALWRHTVRMNARGIAIDCGLVDGAITIMGDEEARLAREAACLGVSNPNSLPQLKAAVNAALDGVETITSLNAAMVDELLEKYPENVTLVALLENRQAGGKSSLAKYPAMRDSAFNGRVHDLTMYYGASRTGRFSGRNVQIQNLPRNNLTNIDLARGIAAKGETEKLRVLFGDVNGTLKELIRTAFIPAPGHTFLIADFSAIEARVIAWLAGEAWVNKVFAGDGRIYEATAAAMFGVPADRIRPGLPEYALRQKGKVATLALGYAGSTGALINMGALRMGLSEAELPDIVKRWRTANPYIVQLWADTEEAALETAQTCQPTRVRGLLTFTMKPVNGAPALLIRLPNGRELYYLGPVIKNGGKFDSPSLHYLDAMAGGKQQLTPTFGGKLVENVVQAIARDCLCLTLTRLEEAGYKVVFHVHDEVIIEAPEGTPLQPVLDIMAQPIPWAPGLVLRGAGFTSQYYMKD